MKSSIMRHFAYDHLPTDLRATSMLCNDMAKVMNAQLPDCAEKSAGLRKLLEAKDCFVRAVIEGRDA